MKNSTKALNRKDLNPQLEQQWWDHSGHTSNAKGVVFRQLDQKDNYSLEKTPDNV